MKNITLAIILCTITNTAIASTIGDIGDKISFKILPIYSAAATVYNSNWTTWYDYDWNGLKQLIVVNLVKSTVTDSLKEQVHEMRPNGLGFDSFPSGHTSNAFAHAAFIHRRYGIKQAATPYALATFVGYSRVHDRWHYTHDVLAGAAIGFLSAWIFADPQQNFSISADTNSIRLGFNTTF